MTDLRSGGGCGLRLLFLKPFGLGALRSAESGLLEGQDPRTSVLTLAPYSRPYLTSPRARIDPSGGLFGPSQAALTVDGALWRGPERSGGAYYMELGPGPRYEDPVPLTDLTPRSGVPPSPSGLTSCPRRGLETDTTTEHATSWPRGQYPEPEGLQEH